MNNRGWASARHYSWVVVGLSFLAVSVSTGVRQSIVILFPELLTEFGWSRTVLSVAPGLVGVVGSATALAIGALSTRMSLRILIAGAAVIGSLGIILSRYVNAPWHLYLSFGLLVAIGVTGLSPTPHIMIINNWFTEKRGLAIGIVGAGSGAGVLVFMPLIQSIVGRTGWRSSYLLMGLILLAMVPLIILFQRDNPGESAAPRRVVDVSEPSSNRSVLRALVRRPRFWLTYVQFVLGPLSVNPVTIHQAALLRGRGVPAMLTAWIVALYGASVMLGMVTAGLLSDRFNRERAYTLGTVFLLLGCGALLLLRSDGSVTPALFYAVFFGFGFGSRPSMDAATASDIFGGRHFGFVFGTLATALGLGNLVGPILAGAIFDLTGSYNGALLFTMGAVCVATVCIWLAAPRNGREPLDLQPADR